MIIEQQDRLVKKERRREMMKIYLLSDEISNIFFFLIWIESNKHEEYLKHCMSGEKYHLFIFLNHILTNQSIILFENSSWNERRESTERRNEERNQNKVEKEIIFSLFQIQLWFSLLIIFFFWMTEQRKCWKKLINKEFQWRSTRFRKKRDLIEFNLFSIYFSSHLSILLLYIFQFNLK